MSIDTPAHLGAAAERVLAARGQSEPLKRLFDRSPVPMILFDGERRYVDVNRPARLVFRLPLAELRRLRIDDLTPPAFLTRLREAWAVLLEAG